jgi:Holliday junction resolvase RusA-like endonuclease
VISFTVLGIARPGGSKKSLVPINRHTGQPFRRPGGGIVASTVDANPKVKDWQRVVADRAAELELGALLDGPLALTLTFYRPRPKGHSGRRGLRSSAPRYPIGRPDLLKLARAVEDALTGVVWRDDAQIVAERLFKDWGEPARVCVEIEPLDPRSRESLVSPLLQE